MWMIHCGLRSNIIKHLRGILDPCVRQCPPAQSKQPMRKRLQYSYLQWSLRSSANTRGSCSGCLWCPPEPLRSSGRFDLFFRNLCNNSNVISTCISPPPIAEEANVTFKRCQLPVCPSIIIRFQHDDYQALSASHSCCPTPPSRWATCDLPIKYECSWISSKLRLVVYLNLVHCSIKVGWVWENSSTDNAKQ